MTAESHAIQRPTMQSQLSNSVPSTPLQQPRDLRFHSRSPSPNRRLSNQSPRSVVSEAVGPAGSVRGNGGVCRFETGAEIRKRRIPYVEGGNEELGPPKIPPKKVLEPDERDKLTGDMRELYDRLLPSEESEQRRARLVQKLDRILNDEYAGSQIRVNVFGSSGNLLSSSDSDVDICITTPLKKLDMHALAELLHQHGMQKVICRASAKVPIIKCWDPELELATDLNVNNPLALENTRMIKTYVQLDERVRPLAKIIKYWTKRRILNDAAFGGTISSYTWICMIISFLQQRDPPILPSLQKIEGKRKERVDDETHAGGETEMRSKFADDVDSIKGPGDANDETLADLLFHFFRYYGYEFEYSKFVVSVKEGRLLSRKEKGWDPSNYADKEARNRLCVEEPFTTNRNLGNSADDYAWSGIHGEIRRACDLLADGCQLEKCCEEYEFPPEELKPVFQRPPPKPKPTLTRSASQSGRPNLEQGSGRSKKNVNRNQSSQRPGNRRASSGATFSNQRVPLTFQSPPLTLGMMDYFAAKGSLHDHLAQQYQLLQAQQEALQARLTQRKQQSQAQNQSGEMPSPRQGSRPFLNGIPSPHVQVENPLPTAPLLPGYLYHYPARFPPSSSVSQARSREGTNTSPSSPSLVAAVPNLRRQAHRASVPDNSSASVRSQSQPGRSLPHPLSLQQQFHPGYDLTQPIGGQYQGMRTSQSRSYGLPVSSMPFSPLTAVTTTALPKEYVGYYVGQSPQLGPQHSGTQPAQMPPHMSLPELQADSPRNEIPDFTPPISNGGSNSRSASPVMHLRSYSTIDDLRSAQLQDQNMYGHERPAEQEAPSQSLEAPMPMPTPTATAPMDEGGPLIVNGSNNASTQPLPEPVEHNLQTIPSERGSQLPNVHGAHPPRLPTLPLRTKIENLPPQDTAAALETPSRTSPSVRQKPSPRLDLSSVNGTSAGKNGMSESLEHEPASVQAAVLSPVVEMRTPSPKHTNAFDKNSPQPNGLTKAAKIASAINAERASLESPTASPKHERKGSAPNPTAHTKSGTKGPASLTEPSPQSAGVEKPEKNPWQQATGKKGHKKSKSLAGAKTASGPGGHGQALPVNESDRKGG